jgi:hypothetical protein
LCFDGLIRNRPLIHHANVFPIEKEPASPGRHFFNDPGLFQKIQRRHDGIEKDSSGGGGSASGMKALNAARNANVHQISIKGKN